MLYFLCDQYHQGNGLDPSLSDFLGTHCNELREKRINKLFPLAASRWLALTVSTILWPVAAPAVGRCWWQIVGAHALLLQGHEAHGEALFAGAVSV